MKERKYLAAYLVPVAFTDNQIGMIELFCAEVQAGLDHAIYQDMRRCFEMLVVRCKLAIENHEKAAYIPCKLCEQQRSHALTSPSSSNHNIPPVEITAKLVIERLKQRKTTESVKDNQFPTEIEENYKP